MRVVHGSLLTSRFFTHGSLRSANETAAPESCFTVLLSLFMLVGFQVRVFLLLLRRDSLPFIRSAIFVGSFRAWLDAHAKFPFPLGLLSAAM